MAGQASTIGHDERRDALRLSAVMRARIIMPNHRSYAPCEIRDVSRSGARLRIDASWLIPQAFWLRIDDDPVLRYYTIAWRTATEVGIERATPKRKKSWTRNWRDLIR